MFYFLYQGRERFFFLFLTKKGWMEKCLQKWGTPDGDGRHLAPAWVAAFRRVQQPRQDGKKLKRWVIFLFYKLQNFCRNGKGC